MTEANAINAATTGIVGNTGTGFTGTAVTNHAVIVGGSTSSTLTNVSPSATSGIPLVSNGSSADPSFTTAVVAGGGTGATSFNINGPVISNTTTTGALASITLTNQQLLVGNTSAAPTAKAFSVVIQVFSGSGTYTPTSGMVYCIIELVGSGGGGGGAGADGSGTQAIGGGGGAGGYACQAFSASTIGASQSVTIGAGGTGGSNSGGNGGNGNTTSVGALVSASGGSGGTGTTAAAGQYAAGGAGGAGGGTFGMTGQAGFFGFNFNIGGVIAFQLSGTGGSSYFGPGGQQTNTVGTGKAGSQGGGGGGSVNASTGGAGGAGYVKITEFVLA